MYRIKDRDGEQEYGTLLEALEECQLLTLELSKDKKACTLTEECDRYFFVELNREQMLALITELRAFIYQMEGTEKEG
jgi:hypothetical protein